MGPHHASNSHHLLRLYGRLLTVWGRWRHLSWRRTNKDSDWKENDCTWSKDPSGHTALQERWVRKWSLLQADNPMLFKCKTLEEVRNFRIIMDIEEKPVDKEFTLVFFRACPRSLPLHCTQGKPFHFTLNMRDRARPPRKNLGKWGSEKKKKKKLYNDSYKFAMSCEISSGFAAYFLFFYELLLKICGISIRQNNKWKEQQTPFSNLITAQITTSHRDSLAWLLEQLALAGFCEERMAITAVINDVAEKTAMNTL